MKLLILLFSIVIVSSVSFLAYGELFPSYLDQIIQNHNKSLWNVGSTLQDGDLYEYKICSDKNIQFTIHPYHCYNITLEFVSILTSYKGDVWVVQGNFTTPDISRQMILMIHPETFEVQTDKLNVDLGESLENTIFSLSEYQNKSLKIGNVWGVIPSYFTNDIPLEIKRQELLQTPTGNIDTFVLGYDIVDQSNYYISEKFPFPVKASILSPNIIYPEPVELYYYELQSHSNKNDENSYDEKITDIVIDEPEIIEYSVAKQ